LATIGVAASEDERTSGFGEGVYWSLPLANLRYYGTVKSKRSSFRDSTRLSVPEVQLLALGAYLDHDSLQEFLLVAKLFQTIWVSCLESLQQDVAKAWDKEGKSDYPESAEWFVNTRHLGISSNSKLLALQYLSYFRRGVEFYLTGDRLKQDMALKLVNYGSRHGKQWFGTSSSAPRLFPLSGTLKSLRSHAERVSLLRRLCNQSNVRSSNAIIRYFDSHGKHHLAGLQDPPPAELEILDATAEERPTKRRRKKSAKSKPTKAKVTRRSKQQAEASPKSNIRSAHVPSGRRRTG
jgi:hypothetical protein